MRKICAIALAGILGIAIPAFMTVSAGAQEVNPPADQQNISPYFLAGGAAAFLALLIALTAENHHHHHFQVSP